MKKAVLLFTIALTIGWTIRSQPLLSHARVNTTVSFDREIVRILSKKCIACHSDSNLGVPFTSYEQTRPWSRAIQEEVLRRHMPPWRAVPGYGQFVNDIALTGKELQFIVAWVEGNGPKTKDQQLVVNFDQVKARPDEQLKLDVGKWQLGKPDLLKSLAPHSIAPGQGDEVRRVVVDLGFTSDQWIRALEFKPGDRRVVRAAFFSVQETGQWVGSWTPWYGVTTLPADTAYLVPAGSHVIAEIHYRSASEAIDDRGTLGLYLAPRPATHSPTDLVVETKGDGAPGPRGQKFSGSMKVPADVTVLAFRPELQAGVESVEVTARKADGTVQVLLLVRNALPEWPTPYILSKPVLLPKNTELSVTSYYNRSAAAPPPAGLKLTVSLSGVAGPTATK